jgi:hypothetical protein
MDAEILVICVEVCVNPHKVIAEDIIYKEKDAECHT